MSEEGRVRAFGDSDQIGVTLGGCEFIKPRAEWQAILERINEDEDAQREKDRADFLSHANQLIEYWDSLPEYDRATGRKIDQHWRIHGVVFSMLSWFDGCSDGAWVIRRAIVNGETGEHIGEGPDIAGFLHELLGNHSKNAV